MALSRHFRFSRQDLKRASVSWVNIYWLSVTLITMFRILSKLITFSFAEIIHCFFFHFLKVIILNHNLAMMRRMLFSWSQRGEEMTENSQILEIIRLNCIFCFFEIRHVKYILILRIQSWLSSRSSSLDIYENSHFYIFKSIILCIRRVTRPQI